MSYGTVSMVYGYCRYSHDCSRPPQNIADSDINNLILKAVLLKITLIIV